MVAGKKSILTDDKSFTAALKLQTQSVLSSVIWRHKGQSRNLEAAVLVHYGKSLERAACSSFSLVAQFVVEMHIASNTINSEAGEKDVLA